MDSMCRAEMCWVTPSQKQGQETGRVRRECDNHPTGVMCNDHSDQLPTLLWSELSFPGRKEEDIYFILIFFNLQVAAEFLLAGNMVWLKDLWALLEIYV